MAILRQSFLILSVLILSGGQILAAGSMKETRHDAVMERVDAQGRVIGFSVLGVSRFKKGKPLEAELASTSRSAVVREKPRKKYGK